MCDLVFSIQEFLKLVPGLVIFPFSLYFAWKRIGNKISASISSSHEITMASRISSVVVRNMKEKPLTIFAIYAVVNNEVYFQVEKFEPPIIVRPLEAIKIDTRPYSCLSLGIEKYEPRFLPSKGIEIYMVLAQKVIKCKMVSHPDTAAIPAFRKYRLATKEVRTFNGLVYNDDAAYAIMYRVNSEIKTAIVDRSGIILRNWDFWFNAIPQEHMKNEMDLKNYLGSVEFDKATEWFGVHALNSDTPAVGGQ